MDAKEKVGGISETSKRRNKKTVITEEGNKWIAEFDGIEFKIVDGINYPKGKHQWEITLLPHLNEFSVYGDKDYAFKKCNLKYHSSWNWLMPVVEKIESIYDDFHGYFGVHIYSNSCTIQGSKLRTDPENFHPAYMSDPNAILETKIASTWYNVVEFIKWYNKNQQP